MSEKMQFNLDLSNNLNSDNLSAVRTDRSQLSDFLGSEIRHFKKKLRDQSRDDSIGRLLNQMNKGKTSYKKNKHTRTSSSVNKFTSPFREQLAIGMGEDNVLDLLAAPLDRKTVLQFYKNNSKPRTQSVEKNDNPASENKKKRASPYEQAKLRINKNKAALNLAEKLKLLMMDNVKTFFIRANFIVAIRAIEHRSTTARNSRRSHKEPKADFNKANAMILKLKDFQQQLSSNLKYIQPKDEQQRFTDRTYNFSLANTPRKFSDKTLPSGVASTLETAKYATMLPKRSENIQEQEKFPKFASSQEESGNVSPSFALQQKSQPTTESKNPNPGQIVNFKSFLSLNSGKTDAKSSEHENLSTDPNQTLNQSFRTTFLKDSIITQPSNKPLLDSSPNSTISSSKSQNPLQEKSTEIPSLLLNQSQSFTPAKKVHNTTLDSNSQDYAEISSSSIHENVNNSNQSRQSNFLAKMQSLSQSILTPEKTAPKKTDNPAISQSKLTKKLQFNSNNNENEKKLPSVSEANSLNGLISALEAKTKVSLSDSCPLPPREDDTFDQIIKEIPPPSKIEETPKISPQDQSSEMSPQSKVIKIQVLLLQKVHHLKKFAKTLNKHNGIGFAFSQLKNQQTPKNQRVVQVLSPSANFNTIERSSNSFDASPNSFGFALGLDKISETDSVAASARNRDSRVIITGRSSPISQNYSNQPMQQKIQCALHIEKVLSHSLRKIYHVFFKNLALHEVSSPLHSDYPHENQGTARSNLSITHNTLSTKPINNLNFIKIREGETQSDGERDTRDRSGNSTLRFGELGLGSSTRAIDSFGKGETTRDGFVSGTRTVRFYEDDNRISDTFEESESQMSPGLVEKKKRTQRQAYKSALSLNKQNSPSEGHQDGSFDYSPATSYKANLDQLEKRLEKLFENQIDSKIDENFNKKLEYHLITLLSKGLASLKPLIHDSEKPLDPEITNSAQNDNLLERRARSVESPYNKVQEQILIKNLHIENEPERTSPSSVENKLYNKSPTAAGDDWEQKQQILIFEQDEKITKTPTYSPKNNRRNIQFYSPQPFRNKNNTESLSTRSEFMLRDKFTSSSEYIKRNFKDQDFQNSMTKDKSKLFALALEKGVGEISKKIMFFFVFDKIMTRVKNDQLWGCFRKLQQTKQETPRMNRFQKEHYLQQQTSETSLHIERNLIESLPLNEFSDKTAKSLYLGRLLQRLFLERMKYGFYKVNMHYLALKYSVTDKKKLLYSLIFAKRVEKIFRAKLKHGFLHLYLTKAKTREYKSILLKNFFCKCELSIKRSAFVHLKGNSNIKLNSQTGLNKLACVFNKAESRIYSKGFHCIQNMRSFKQNRAIRAERLINTIINSFRLELREAFQLLRKHSNQVYYLDLNKKTSIRHFLKVKSLIIHFLCKQALRKWKNVAAIDSLKNQSNQDFLKSELIRVIKNTIDAKDLANKSFSFNKIKSHCLDEKKQILLSLDELKIASSDHSSREKILLLIKFSRAVEKPLQRNKEFGFKALKSILRKHKVLQNFDPKIFDKLVYQQILCGFSQIKFTSQKEQEKEEN